MKLPNQLYHLVKYLLPRSVQIALRRCFVRANIGRFPRVWPIDRAAGRQPERWKGWPSGRDFAFVLTHDVETMRGVDRCLALAELEKDLGLVSSFNFVPHRYPLPSRIRRELTARGFEVGVHDLKHDGRLFESEEEFKRRCASINGYLESWGAVGFRAGSMYHNLNWMHELRIEYDASTFDTDPFEPQPDGVRTIFPFWVPASNGTGGYVELPYTLPQDMILYVLLKHRTTDLWKQKLQWIAENGGMVLLVAHPDYMYWGQGRRRVDEYPVDLYREFLLHVTRRYSGRFWNALPRNVARYWKHRMSAPPCARC